MANNIESIKAEIQEKLKKLANIQPKNDHVKYLDECQKVYMAYYRAKGVEIRHLKVEDCVVTAYENALSVVNEALEKDF